MRSGAGFGLGAVLAQPFVVSGDWICLGTTGTITCTGPNVAPGGSTSVYLRVRAANDAAGTTPVSVTVSATGLAPVTVTGTTGVAAKGVSARYAGFGPPGGHRGRRSAAVLPDRRPRAAPTRAPDAATRSTTTTGT